MTKPEPPTVRIKPSNYQPSKAELEERIRLPPKPDGTAWTPDEVAHALLQPVRVVEDPDA